MADMTGRKGRVVVQGLPGGRQQVVYELRAKPDSAEMDSLNVGWGLGGFEWGGGCGGSARLAASGVVPP
jgi:hypothetical protein